MPWCNGTMKVKGKKEDIIKFMREVLKSEGKAIYEESKNAFKIKQGDEVSWFYVEGTDKNFVDAREISFEFKDGDREYVLLLDKYKAHWNIDPKPLEHLSREYNVDFKILGFNKDLEFNQDVEIVKGNVVKNEWLEFKNYEWECVLPSL